MMVTHFHPSGGSTALQDRMMGQMQEITGQMKVNHWKRPPTVNDSDIRGREQTLRLTVPEQKEFTFIDR